MLSSQTHIILPNLDISWFFGNVATIKLPKLLVKFRINAYNNIGVDHIFRTQAWDTSGNIFGCIFYDENHAKVFYGTVVPVFDHKLNGWNTPMFCF